MLILSSGSHKKRVDMMKIKTLLTMLTGILLLAACAPATPIEPTPDVNVIRTSAAYTVVAEFTLTAAAFTPTALAVTDTPTSEPPTETATAGLTTDPTLAALGTPPPYSNISSSNITLWNV